MHRNASDLVNSCTPATAGKDQPRRPNHIQQHASGESFIKRGALFDRYVTRQTQPQEFLRGEPSASVADRHHDAIDAFTTDQRAQFRGQSYDTGIDEALADERRIVIHKTDDAKTGIRTAESFARDLDGERT